MKDFYIKFIEWDKEDLQRVCKLAEILGYSKPDLNDILNFKWTWVLWLHNYWEFWHYFTTTYTEQELIVKWYIEYKEWYSTDSYWSITKLQQPKTITITTGNQELEITEEKARELWFNF